MKGITKLETGIPGLDLVTHGGFPLGRGTLVSGTAGSGKTVLAMQFLARGIKDYDEPGVFVTFEEPASEISLNMAGFGWDIEQWESSGKLAFVDASPDQETDQVIMGDYDLAPLLARIEHAIKKSGAKRLAMDSMAAVMNRFDPPKVRQELFKISHVLRKMGVTFVMTMERNEEYGDIGSHRVEQFVMDNVIILRNLLAGEERNRTLEILKFRGSSHQKGEQPFVILDGEGMEIIPFSNINLQGSHPGKRTRFGVPGLDEMWGGGIFPGSVSLVSGATGTGKTLTAVSFMRAGAEVGSRCIYFGFEESREQLFHNLLSSGTDLEKLEKDGLIKVECFFPEAQTPFEHFIRILRLIDEFDPDRVCIDSISAIRRICNEKTHLGFLVGMVSELKKRGISAVFNSSATELMGGSSITESHVSTICDNIILLRYLEVYGEMKRGIMVLKMRGSDHDRRLLEVLIDGDGLRVGEPFRAISGVFTRTPEMFSIEEKEKIDKKFG